MRIYGPNLYSRPVVEGDAGHIQRILSDWEDWPLSDQKAEALTKIWANRNLLWRAPLQEGVIQESSVLFCLKTNDLPVFLTRDRQEGTVGRSLFAVTDPDYRLNGYLEEAVKLCAIGIWEHYGFTKSYVQEWKDNNSIISHRIRDDLEIEREFSGTTKQNAPDYKETLMLLEHWTAFKNSSAYADWVIPYTLYPKWPGDPL